MSDKKWADNTLQFARLIAELEAVGAITLSVMQDLCTSMDLETNQVNELIDRAQKYWDDKKKMPTIAELRTDGEVIDEYAIGDGYEGDCTVYVWQNRRFIVNIWHNEKTSVEIEEDNED